MAIKIIILKDKKPIDQRVITTDEISIGRKSDCDISIKDPAVSGNHAKVQRVGDKWLIQDLGSTNGIYIGNRRVKQQALETNELVHIGAHQLKFIIDEDTTARKPATGASGFLKVLSGKQAGEKIPLVEALTTIGEPGIQVAAVSRRLQGHFIIHVDGGKDRERVPLVNGEPTGFRSRKLEAGDKIEVAGIEMEYSDG